MLRKVCIIAAAAGAAVMAMAGIRAIGLSRSNDVAVIVNPQVPAENLSLAEVRQIMLGERLFWAPRMRVTILMRSAATREHDVVLKKIYQMSDAQYKHYWIAKVFRQEATSDPKLVHSNQVANDLVARLPGAIAFVDSSQVARDVRVLRVDGRLPGEKGYPLQ